MASISRKPGQGFLSVSGTPGLTSRILALVRPAASAEPLSDRKQKQRKVVLCQIAVVSAAEPFEASVAEPYEVSVAVLFVDLNVVVVVVRVAVFSGVLVAVAAQLADLALPAPARSPPTQLRSPRRPRNHRPSW
jgi:hypothetical protein